MMRSVRWLSMAFAGILIATSATPVAAQDGRQGREGESPARMQRSAGRHVTLRQAQAIIEAARKKAEEIGVPMNIAIVDEGANLTAFVRMDNAWLGSIDIAQGKAYTARAFNLSTRELGKLSQPGQPLFGIHATNHGRIVIFAGGIPLKVNGRVVGAIGVSGGTVEQDQTVAESGAAAFSSEGRSGE